MTGVMKVTPGRDVVDIAQSVARWTWDHYNGCRTSNPHFAMLQRRRRVKGGHGDGGDSALSWLYRRNMGIQNDRASGMTWANLETMYHLSRSQLKRIVKMQLERHPDEL